MSPYALRRTEHRPYFRIPESTTPLTNDSHFHEFLLSLRRRFSHNQQTHIIHAADLMYALHVDQAPYDGHTPYYRHSLAVAHRTLNLLPHASPEPIIAAFLHDGPEDQPEKLAAHWPYQSLPTLQEQAFAATKHLYGSRVQTLVRALTNPDFDAILRQHGLTPDHPEYQSCKHGLYAQHVEHAIQDPDVAVIKFSDFIGNIGNIQHIADSDRRAYLQQKYTPVVSIFISRFIDTHRPVFPSKHQRNAVLQQLYPFSSNGTR